MRALRYNTNNLSIYFIEKFINYTSIDGYFIANELLFLLHAFTIKVHCCKNPTIIIGIIGAMLTCRMSRINATIFALIDLHTLTHARTRTHVCI